MWGNQKARCHRALQLDPPPSASPSKVANQTIAFCVAPSPGVQPLLNASAWLREPFWDGTRGQSQDGRIRTLPHGIHKIRLSLEPVWNLCGFEFLLPFDCFCSKRSLMSLWSRLAPFTFYWMSYEKVSFRLFVTHLRNLLGAGFLTRLKNKMKITPE